MKEKTLYVSDLDGTLLRSNETISDYTSEVINRMTGQGMLFSYATARSIHTAKKVTEGLYAKIPLIVYNGAFIIDNRTGDIFYITCIDTCEKLLPIYKRYKEEYYCVYQKDIYSGEQWLELMPQGTTKAKAIMRLKEILGCKRVVAFGDGVNDIEMFQLADESYAVANAVPELKSIATGIIGENNEDGVARWIEKTIKIPANY